MTLLTRWLSSSRTQCSQPPSPAHRNTREPLSKENLWGCVCPGLSRTGAQEEVCLHPCWVPSPVSSPYSVGPCDGALPPAEAHLPAARADGPALPIIGRNLAGSSLLSFRQISFSLRKSNGGCGGCSWAWASNHEPVSH